MTAAATGAAGGEPDSPSLIRFDVWGARGSRNTVGSAIANRTSCYSLAAGADLFVFDGGSGLLPLSAALHSDAAFSRVRRVHLMVSHAHSDHWEGIKDAEWMWRRDNGLELSILGPREALDAIARACEPPSFVPLDVLAAGTLARLDIVEVRAGTRLDMPGATVEPVALHHYSGADPARRYLQTFGYRLALSGGPTAVYFCDHEPSADTAEAERRALDGADLAIVDASFGCVSEHAFGHGSVESVAALASAFPATRVLAAHHGPLRSDRDIEDSMRRYGVDLPHFAAAVEGASESWDANARRFVPSGAVAQTVPAPRLA